MDELEAKLFLSELGVDDEIVAIDETDEYTVICCYTTTVIRDTEKNVTIVVDLLSGTVEIHR